MDENEIDRASQRANLIEQRMFEITLQSIDTLKHTTAIELHKSQNEMKKRLRKYRDRQREIVRSKPDFDKDPIEELITRQMRNRAKARPKTCPGLRHITPKSTGLVLAKSARAAQNALSSPPATSTNMNGTMSQTLDNSSSDASSSNGVDESDDELELDGSFMIDQQKSKIDLRPKTAIDITRRGVSLDKYAINGRLGSAVKQVRYFDEDELNDRGHFYKHLVDKRISEEKNKLSTLDDKVAAFCGSETVQTMLRKMQNRRKLFTGNVDWANTNVNSVQGTNSSHSLTRNTPSNLTALTSSGRKRIIRPNTSVGFHGSGVTRINSFRKPSYIAT